MSARLPLEGLAEPVGEHSADGHSHSSHQLGQSLLDLPLEVILKVFDQFQPTEPLTSYDSTAMRPDVSHDFFQSRASLANFVLVSRLFHQFGTPLLYRTVLLDNQRQVLLFFRTIAKFPYHRVMVRSLAWATVLSTDDSNRQSTMVHQSQADSIAADCWKSIEGDWPRLPIDFYVAKIMEIVNSSSLQAWRLLGAILALCPKIEAVFMLHSSPEVPRYLPPSPELNALTPLLWDRDHDETEAAGLEDSASPEPLSHQFFSELKQFTIELHEYEISHSNANFIMFLILINSPKLSRVEKRGNMVLRGVWQYFELNPNRKLVAENVKELVVLRALEARDDMLATVRLFTRLVSLQAEYDDASYRPVPRINLSFTISSALLRLADTLETLSLTTAPTSYGFWINLKDHPPSLTSLDQMGKLRDLTTESIWLFGRQDPSVALHLPHLLPPTLVRLRLIDYWGTMGTNEYYPDFYPEFPSGWTAAEFYCNVLMTLGGDNSTHLPDLKEVTLVSKHLCGEEEAQTRTSGVHNGQVDLAENSEASLSKLRRLFRDLGTQFKLEMAVKSTAATQADWARIAR